MTVLSLVLLMALQAAAPEVIQHEQAGIAAQKEGHLDTAILEFQTATEQDPKLAAAFFNLGAVYMQSHRYGDAIKPLKRALELGSDVTGIHELLGYALLSQGYASEAIPQFQTANSHQGLGVAQLEIGDFADAVSNLEVALTNNPNDPDLLYYLGRASGLLSRQVNDLLLSSHPASARAYQSLAENYAALHQAKQAEEAYQKAIQLRPDLPGLHLALGEVYAGAADWENAEREFVTERKLRPGNAETAFRLGSALLQNGKVKEARQQLVLADQLQSDMPETLYALGKAASMDGDNVTAVQSWMKVIALEPKGSLASQAHFALANIYRKQGKQADAERESHLFQEAKDHSSQPQLK